VENTARKQFGNSVVVPLIGSIFGKAASTGIFDEKL
jgi:hypothetical protein